MAMFSSYVSLPEGKLLELGILLQIKIKPHQETPRFPPDVTIHYCILSVDPRTDSDNWLIDRFYVYIVVHIYIYIYYIVHMYNIYYIVHILYYIILHYIRLYHIVLYYIIAYYIIVYYIILYHIILYYILYVLCI